MIRKISHSARTEKLRRIHPFVYTRILLASVCNPTLKVLIFFLEREMKPDYFLLLLELSRKFGEIQWTPN